MFDQKSTDEQLPPINNSPAEPSMPESVSYAPKPPQVEDIFATTDSGANRPPFLRQVQPQNMTNQPDVFGARSVWHNKLLIFLLVVTVLLIFGGIVWSAYYYFSTLRPFDNVKTPATVDSNVNNNTNADANTNTNVDSNVNSNVNTNSVNTDSNTNSIATEPVDTDSDGLTNDEEKKLETDSNNFDTDSDGLTDGAEVNIYKTDPLVSDTDGDGFKDGAEVINGYDPLKPGSARLFDIPKSTN